MRKGIFPAVLIAFFITISTARGVVVLDESITGDISTDPLLPTPLVLGAGVQSVAGTLRTTSIGDNRDWIAVTVPASLELNQYIQTAYSSADAIGFTGFQAGATFTGNPGVEGSYAGYSHYGAGLDGTDLMPTMETAFGATGFTTPLGPGTYTFLIQQTGTSATSYQFDFVLVPEPGPHIAMGLVVGAILLCRFRTAPQLRTSSI